MRYYYKAKDGSGFLNLKSKIEDERYIEITEEEFNATQPAEPVITEEIKATLRIQEQIATIKKQLADTDYLAIKYFEGLLTEEEYAPIREYRQSLRDQINSLE